MQIGQNPFLRQIGAARSALERGVGTEADFTSRQNVGRLCGQLRLQLLQIGRVQADLNGTGYRQTL